MSISIKIHRFHDRYFSFFNSIFVQSQALINFKIFLLDIFLQSSDISKKISRSEFVSVIFINFGQSSYLNGHNYCQFFFVIFDKNDVHYILVKFESDRISPRESAKNGRNGAHGLNCKIFVNFEFRFEIYHKNYPMKKKFMSLRPF